LLGEVSEIGRRIMTRVSERRRHVPLAALP
jgi:hypothetical protein